MTGRSLPAETVENVDLVTPVHQLRVSKTGRQTLLDSARSDPTHLDARSKMHGRKVSKWEARRFVAWDGEGITDSAGRHRYVILANSWGDALVRPEGIRFEEAADMMLRAAGKDKLATHVIFAGSYDVNMILKSALSRHGAAILADTGAVTLRVADARYRVTYHPRHTLELAEEVWDDAEKKCRRPRGRFVLWDVFGSFQSSFVTACKRLLPAEDLAELAHIQDMKGRRSDFAESDIPEMLDYCRAELRALVRLVETDRDNFAAAGFQCSRWDGAGAKASAVLVAKGVGAHKADTPEELKDPIRYAYAGGRIETVRFGYHAGDCYTLDIRSAYPWAATFLPSLSGGRWDRCGGVSTDAVLDGADSFALFKVRYRRRVANSLHPFFWRSPAGNISYPQTVTGWYWAPEVAAALAHDPSGISVVDGWRFTPSTDERPFEFIPRLYEIRAKLEAQVRGRGWPLKLALNSLYGKLAQQIGGKDGRAPRWHQLEWAGWITSKIRATMYALAETLGTDQLIAISTDGLTFRGVPDFDTLGNRVGTELGQYEVETYSAGVWVQSGIYWLRNAAGEWLDPKVRGVGPGALSREAFLAKWQAGDFGPVPVEVTRFRGMVTSCLHPGRWRDWCQWITETRQIAAAPEGKRVHVPDDCPACLSGVPLGSLHSTLPTGGGSHSGLHKLTWVTTVGRTTADEWWLDTLSEDDGDD